MENFGKRALELRKYTKLSQEAFADEIGISSKQTVSNVELGKQKKYTDEEINKIIDKFGISKAWLILGKGEMLELDKEINILEVSSDDNIVIEYRSNAIGGCGSGQAVEQVDHKWLTFSKQLLRGIVQTDRIDELHMIDSFGNSMEPTIKSGEKLFVLPFEKEGFNIREGSVYIIFFAHGVMVKRVYFDKVSGGLKLSGDNKSVSPEEIYTQDELEALTIYGRVVGHMGGMG